MHTAEVTRYTLAAPPAGAALRSFDCAFCHHENLARPVFLDGGAGVIAAGSGCAAVALYGPRPSGRRIVEVEREALALAHRAAVAEELRTERRARYAAAAEEFAGVEVNHADSPALLSCRTTYHASGGFAALGPFGDFLAAVAATGDLPA